MSESIQAFLTQLASIEARHAAAGPPSSAADPALEWLGVAAGLWLDLRSGRPLDVARAATRLGGALASADLDAATFRQQVAALAAADSRQAGELCALLSVLLSLRAAHQALPAEVVDDAAATLGERALDEAGPGRGAAIAVRLARLYQALGRPDAEEAAWRQAVLRDPLVPWALADGPPIVAALAERAIPDTTGPEGELRQAIDDLAGGRRGDAVARLERLAAAPNPRADARFLLAVEHTRDAAAAPPRSPQAQRGVTRAAVLLDGLGGSNPAVAVLRALLGVLALDRAAAYDALHAELDQLTGGQFDDAAVDDLLAALTELIRRPPFDPADILRQAYFEGLLDPLLAAEVPRGPLASFRKLVVGLALASTVVSSGSAFALTKPVVTADLGPDRPVAMRVYKVFDDQGDLLPEDLIVPPVPETATASGSEMPAAPLRTVEVEPAASDSAAATPDAQATAHERDENGVAFVWGHGERADRRQIPEGYWLSQMIEPQDAPGLQADGIRVVLSAVVPSEETIAALQAAGIEQVTVRMGATFRHAATILEVADRYAPDQILVHCTHGADRTGTIAAFLLIERHGWSVADAFYAVVYPSEEQVAGLALALHHMGIDNVRSLEDSGVGIYSPGGRAHGGGLKAHNEAFREIIYTAIAALRVAPPDAPETQLTAAR